MFVIAVGKCWISGIDGSWFRLSRIFSEAAEFNASQGSSFIMSLAFCGVNAELQRVSRTERV